MIRKAFCLLPILALASSVLVQPARAQNPHQFSLYGEVTVDDLSGIQSSPILNTLSPAPCTGSTTTNCTAYNNNVHPIGFTGGGTYDFKTIGPITLAADIRGVVESDKRGAQTNANGSGTRIYSALGGVKATLHTPISLLRPYALGMAGYARSNYGVLTNSQLLTTTTTFPGVPTQNNLEYHIFAGLDLHILPAVDFRVFEAGYGALQSHGNFGHTYPIYSISSGIVFHIPPRD